MTVFVVVCSCVAWWQGQRPRGAEAGHWLGIIPPLSAIILAFVTRRVLFSLGFAVFVGGLLLHVPGKVGTLNAWGAGLGAGPIFFFDALMTPENLHILVFIPLMLAMVLIVTEAGGFNGVFVHISRVIKGRKSAQLATASAGVVYFFDDYSNAMVVGSVMRPLTDSFRISREKLAFIIDSTTAPIASLALISSWIMYEITLFAQSAETMGIPNSGYSIFLDILPYRFYCLFILSLVFLHILLGRDFGPMRAAEAWAVKEERASQKARPCGNAPSSARERDIFFAWQRGRSPDVHRDSQAEKGPLEARSSLATEPKSHTPSTSSFWVAVIPLTGLLLFHVMGMWVDGGGLKQLREGASPAHWSYWREVIGSAEHTVLIFDFAALFGLCLAILSTRFLAHFPFNRILGCLWLGLIKSLVPCLILTFAWSLKNCSDALHTDDFLAALLVENVSLVFLPTLVFVVACLTAFTTGTSWGTMAILIPTVGPVAFRLEGETYGLITMMSLAAVLDGSIFGDHCSPISDTTILSASASQCDLMQHVRTQMPYSILGATVALVCGYLPIALGLHWLVAFGLGIIALTAIFTAFGSRMETPPNGPN